MVHDLSVAREGAFALTVVGMSGEVDAATIARFAQVLSSAAEEAEGSLLVDLDEVNFMNVKGYFALLNADRKMRERGGGVVIVCSRPTTRHIFALLDPRGRWGCALRTALIAGARAARRQRRGNI